ncbi:Predicted dehydrogenase [Devosia crocina]|uniref:Predicted dehydrogenase n=1 Tax=Devosia crocina TaxID=429728 RepID=A0A1I7N1Q0_9HYPH|nr:Gfo/Idh/MocA family oxidoreductase [Devosia crocina]SFV28496.1 Predicted dehydrogenase [Devosia crocina]
MAVKLRVGIVGCGAGRTHLVEGYTPNSDRFDVLALCDLDPRRLAAVADEFGIGRRTLDFAELLAMDDIDVIDICTPPAVHLEQVLAALAAGKHVVCEKPLVGSLAEIDQIIKAEAKAAGRLMPVFQYRYGNGIAKAKAVIDAGLAGKLYAGTVETFWKRGPEYYAVPWRGKWHTELGGVLMAHAIHPHDMLTYLAGPVARAFGRVDTRVNAIEVEDCVSASLRMADGGLVSLTATLGSADQITRIRLAFEHLTIESDHAPYRPGEADWQIRGRTPETEEKIAATLADWQYVPSRHTTQLRLFHEAITTGAPLPVTTADARKALELVTTIYHSARTGHDEALPIGPDHPLYRSWAP